MYSNHENQMRKRLLRHAGLVAVTNYLQQF